MSKLALSVKKIVKLRNKTHENRKRSRQMIKNAELSEKMDSNGSNS